MIAGGGVAALEALLALRELAQDRVEIDLLAPNTEFVFRPMELAALFDDERVQRFDLNRIAADQGATLVVDRLEGVWPDKRVVTQSGVLRPYDSLLIAIGAHLRIGVPGAIDGRRARFQAATSCAPSTISSAASRIDSSSPRPPGPGGCSRCTSSRS